MQTLSEFSAVIRSYMPAAMSPWGMVFYSLVVYIVIFILGYFKRNYLNRYIAESMSNVSQDALKEKRRVDGIEARKLLERQKLN